MFKIKEGERLCSIP